MGIQRQGLLQLGATVYPVENVSLDPAIIIAARQSAGDQAPTQQTVFGGRPSISCTMPMWLALDDIGLKCTKFTVLELSVLDIDQTTGITATGVGHDRYSLAASCSAFASVTGFSVSQAGLATANVEIYCISNNGTTNPISVGTGSALALAAQPTLHTLGPVDVNGSELGGSQSISGTLNHASQTVTSDGDLYPTQYVHSATNPVITVTHSDQSAVIGALGLIGADISSTTKVAFLARASTGLVSATERSITIGDGHLVPMQVGGGVADIITMQYTIYPAAADATTHPWTLA